MEKQRSHAFGKNVFLLGKDADGIYYWLEAPSWDCGWYWGFGFIETYTNNKNPSTAKDINSHEHADDFYSDWWGGGDCKLQFPTFTEKEGWELSELFAQFYHLKQAAEFWGRGKMNIAGTEIQLWTDKAMEKKINETMIPFITDRILKILTP